MAATASFSTHSQCAKRKGEVVGDDDDREERREPRLGAREQRVRGVLVARVAEAAGEVPHEEVAADPVAQRGRAARGRGAVRVAGHKVRELARGHLVERQLARGRVTSVLCAAEVPELLALGRELQFSPTEVAAPSLTDLTTEGMSQEDRVQVLADTFNLYEIAEPDDKEDA